MAGAWYFANELLDPRRAGDPYALKVLAVGDGQVTLPYTQDTEVPGPASLQWRGGYGLLGDTLAAPPGGLVRALTHLVGTPLAPGTPARIKRHAVEGDPQVAFGYDFQEVDVPGPLGALPAWLVPGGAGPTWAVVVHGRSHTRPAALRWLPDLHALGLTTLVVTYRNDTGAPPSPDGCYHLGDTEWTDLQAAVADARRRGAERIVLVCDSMGAAIALQFLERSGLAPRVAAMVTDSPLVDWHRVLVLAARQRHVPGVLTLAAKAVARSRVGVRWSQFDMVTKADQLTVPMLIFHGDADTTVPVTGSEALARRRPDLVSLVQVPGAEHLEAWVKDRPGCSAALQAFLAPRLGVATPPAVGPAY